MEYIYIRSREHLKRVMRKYEKPKRMLTYDTLGNKNCYIPSEDVFMTQKVVEKLGFTKIE